MKWLSHSMWSRVGVEYLIIVLCFSLTTLYPYFFWLFAFIIGTRQHALAILGHWAIHGLTKASSLLQAVCFFPTGVDPANYKKHHYNHHANVGNKMDVEVGIATQFKDRWQTVRWWDSVLDAVGLHYDEMLAIFKTLMSPISMVVYGLFMLGLFYLFGWAALLWPLGSATGVMFCQRLRARTEHDHLNKPGVNIVTAKPSLFKRMLYLPHYTWLHAEHHALPGKRIWEDVK